MLKKGILFLLLLLSLLKAYVSFTNKYPSRPADHHHAAPEATQEVIPKQPKQLTSQSAAQSVTPVPQAPTTPTEAPLTQEKAIKDEESWLSNFYHSIFGIQNEEELEGLSQAELLRASERLEEEGHTRYPAGYLEARKKDLEDQKTPEELEVEDQEMEEDIEKLLADPNLPEDQRRELLELKKIRQKE